MTQRNRSRALVALFAALVLTGACFGGQIPASPPIGLKITIVEGDGAINNITEGRARDPVVRVAALTRPSHARNSACAAASPGHVQVTRPSTSPFTISGTQT